MDGIWQLVEGRRIPAVVNRLYHTHGPYMIGSRRLDQLSKVVVLVDSSTTTTRSTGTNESTASTASVIGRAAVAGVIAGPLAGVIGGTTAKRARQCQQG